MKIAIITGASAGLGEKLLEKSINAFPEINEYWLIAHTGKIGGGCGAISRQGLSPAGA